MSPRKLTEDDKQEILQQYRNTEATTSTLAKSFEVSSSTISRFLKNKLSTDEYEDLIQQKRLARTPRGEKSAKDEDTEEKTKTKAKKTKAKKTKAKSAPKQPKPEKVLPDLELEDDTLENGTSEENLAENSDSKPTIVRRRRRRRVVSSDATQLSLTEDLESAEDTELETSDTDNTDISVTEVEPQPETDLTPDTPRLILDRITRDKPAESSNENEPAVSQRLILKGDRVESEEDDDEVDILTLKEMLGEDLEDINDDEDEDDDEEWEEEESSPRQNSDLGDVEILPLSQANLPRTCYLVIDRSAELIVKPLSEFADLGIIPEAEVRQRTLPVFDNHRIAKRFSHRRERVIKVPDGRMLQKTSHHLQDKGITRLLIDGQIYSISH